MVEVFVGHARVTWDATEPTRHQTAIVRLILLEEGAQVHVNKLGRGMWLSTDRS